MPAGPLPVTVVAPTLSGRSKWKRTALASGAFDGGVGNTDMADAAGEVKGAGLGETQPTSIPMISPRMIRFDLCITRLLFLQKSNNSQLRKKRGVS